MSRSNEVGLFVKLRSGQSQDRTVSALLTRWWR